MLEDLSLTLILILTLKLFLTSTLTQCLSQHRDCNYNITIIAVLVTERVTVAQP